jgi:hypothetical protein
VFSRARCACIERVGDLWYCEPGHVSAFSALHATQPLRNMHLRSFTPAIHAPVRCTVAAAKEHSGGGGGSGTLVAGLVGAAVAFALYLLLAVSSVEILDADEVEEEGEDGDNHDDGDGGAGNGDDAE